MLKKQCPSCDGELAIWHATIYRTFAPDELTREKLKDLDIWLHEVVKPALAKILGVDEDLPNVCPHCATELTYINQPVTQVWSLVQRTLRED